MNGIVVQTFASFEPFDLKDIGGRLRPAGEDVIDIGVGQAESGWEAIFEKLDIGPTGFAGSGAGISGKALGKRSGGGGRAAWGSLSGLAGAADEREEGGFIAALVVGHVAIVVIGENDASGEVGEDAALSALEDGAIADAGKVDVAAGSGGFEAALVPDDLERSAPGVGRMLEMSLEFDRADLGMVFVADIGIDIDFRGGAGVDDIPDEVHGVGAHIAHLADAEIAVHVPEQAVQAVRAAEVLGAVGMVRRGADPLFIMELSRGIALGVWVTGTGEFAGIPAMDTDEVADGAVEYELAEAFKVGIGMALSAVLGGELGFLTEIVGADGTNLFDRDAERLFAEDVHAAVEGPVGDEGMVMIGGADDDGFDILLVENAAPIPVKFCLGEDLSSLASADVVDVTQGHDIFIAQGIVVSRATSPDTDQGNIQAVAWSRLAAQDASFQDGEASGPAEQFSTIHARYRIRFITSR